MVLRSTPSAEGLALQFYTLQPPHLPDDRAAAQLELAIYVYTGVQGGTHILHRPRALLRNVPLLQNSSEYASCCGAQPVTIPRFTAPRPAEVQCLSNSPHPSEMATANALPSE
jgi:hypothetical protein